MPIGGCDGGGDLCGWTGCTLAAGAAGGSRAVRGAGARAARAAAAADRRLRGLGRPGQQRRSCRCGTSGRSRSWCTTPPRPTCRPQPGSGRPARPRHPELPHGPPRLARHRAALHDQPRRVRAGGPAPQPGDAARGPAAGRGRALHGPEHRRRRHRERGHLHRVDPPPELWNRLRDLCAYDLPAVRDPAHRDLRPPRLQEHRLPGRPALRHAAAAARRRWPGVLGQRRSSAVREGVVAAAAAGRPGRRR